MRALRTRRRSLWVLVAVAAGAAALAAARQDPPAQQANSTQPQPTFTVEANYVRVDLYPTAGGLPVEDLAEQDLEVLEDGVVQKIVAFERVSIGRPRPDALRIEPGTVADSRAMAANARARVFVLFLDTNHVDAGASRTIGKPLVNALNSLIGAEDLVAVMTPGMSAADVTFARRTATIESLLLRQAGWGERERPTNPRLEEYRRCYPGYGPTQLCPDDDRGVADEMIARYTENETIEALQDLVTMLGGVREERKAVVVISDGWRLFRASSTLGRRLACRVPQAPTGIDPAGGLTGRSASTGATTAESACDGDRMVLASTDNDATFREILDRANRSNVSFYPVDPRGLAVFDTSLSTVRTGLRAPGEPSVLPLAVDGARLRAREDSLRTMAAATDGLAVMGSNDLDAGLRRIVDDLSSYYLLGYYSTGKLDGKFHEIRVRARRPGVQVRARRGYLAATAAEVARAVAVARPDASAPGAATTNAAAVAAAVGALGGVARDVPLRLAAAGGWTTPSAGTIWIVGDLDAASARMGADVDVMLASPGGDTVATAREQLAPGVRGFKIGLSKPGALTSGEYIARVRVRPAEPDRAALTETIRIAFPPSPVALDPLVFRRGPATANRETVTADRRFRRNERLRVEYLDPEVKTASARLLDRTGKDIPVPVTATVRTDADGSRWRIAELTLAPLAPGDYVLELSGDNPAAPGLVAFRVIP